MGFLNIQLQEDEAVVIDAILVELRRARDKHPHFAETLAEAALVISEEAGEVSQAILKYRYEGGDFGDIRKEAIEVACTAMRLALAIDLKQIEIPALYQHSFTPREIPFSVANGFAKFGTKEDDNDIPLENINPDSY